LISRLTPIWLACLGARALGVFITVLRPIVASPDHVKLSDWFGFAGSSRAAMVTLAAATLAWRASSGADSGKPKCNRGLCARRRNLPQERCSLRIELTSHLCGTSHQATCRAALSYGPDETLGRYRIADGMTSALFDPAFGMQQLLKQSRLQKCSNFFRFKIPDIAASALILQEARICLHHFNCRFES